MKAEGQPPGPLERVRIVLVDPSEPGNVGAAARVLLNMGMRRLLLVPRRVDAAVLLGEDARRLAGRAAGLLERAEVLPDLPAALAGTVYSVAATARPRVRPEMRRVEGVAEEVLPRLAGGGEAALVFGPEDRGLTNRECDLCPCVATIPTDPLHPSLNLAQAVLLFCWEIRRGLGPETPPAAQRPARTPAPAEEREAMVRQMEEVLLEIGYLDPAAPHHILGDLRRLLDRAEPTSREVSLLRGVWSQVAWAAGRAREDG